MFTRKGEHMQAQQNAEAQQEGPDAVDVYARLAHDVLDRLRCEVSEIADDGFAASGSALAKVLMLKGKLSSDELAGGVLLGGADGDALRAALARLGYAPDEWAALSTVKCARAAGKLSWSPADDDALAWAIEVIDPETVIAVDDEAAGALCKAWKQDADWLSSHEVVRLLGRRAIALGGFADALGDIGSKRVMWERLKLVPPLGTSA
jgi:hypothetical protein